MKYSDMNQYITLLFSLLAEFFLPHRTPSGPVARGLSPASARVRKNLFRSFRSCMSIAPPDVKNLEDLEICVFYRH